MTPEAVDPGRMTGRTSALVVIAGTVLGVVLFGRLPSQALWASDLANFAHGPAFATVTLVALVLLRRSPTCRRKVLLHYGAAILAAMALGVVVELLQAQIGRDAEVGDVLRDGLGALAAAGFAAGFDRRLTSFARRLALSCGVACTMGLAWPLAEAGIAYRQRDSNFPVLADFGQSSSQYFLAGFGSVDFRLDRPESSAGVPGAQSPGLRVTVGSDGWWGLFLREPRPDWRGFSRIAFLVDNPMESPLALQLRVHDAEPGHRSRDGFCATITVPAHSVQNVVVPFERLGHANPSARLDLGRVESVILARSGRDRERVFYLHRVWLE